MSHVYVASKYENRAAVREAMDKFEAAGHTIARDWTTHIPWDWNDPEEVKRRAPELALQDWEGVLECDVFVFLIPKDQEQKVHMIGAYVELGIALGDSDVERKIYIVGDNYYNTFAYHPFIQHVDTIEEVIDALALETV